MRRKLLIAAFVSALVLAAGGAGAAYLMFGRNSPVSEVERTVIIPPGASFQSVIDSLDSADVLTSRNLFALAAYLTGWGDQIKAGHYIYSGGYSNYELLSILRRGLQVPVRVTIPPGSRAEVIAEMAARNMAFDAETFLQALGDSTLANELGTNVQGMLGYMLPETYFFYWLTDAPTVIRRVKEEAERLVEAELAAAGSELETDVILSIASIVEWETAVTEEMPTVAGVYLNRLDRNWPLQADPTIQFALLDLEGEKRRLLVNDYSIDHPYNTYHYTGLPPGPITNPSASSIRAVARSEKHNFMFFVAKPGGGHAFNSTLSGHHRDARAFHRYMRDRRAQVQNR